STIIREPRVPSSKTYKTEMVSSIWPSRFSQVNSHTPRTEPARPPISRMKPILKSTLPRRQCAMTPDTEAPTSWLAEEATATAGGAGAASAPGGAPAAARLGSPPPAHHPPLKTKIPGPLRGRCFGLAAPPRGLFTPDAAANRSNYVINGPHFPGEVLHRAVLD